jgi:hypothetical protein
MKTLLILSSLATSALITSGQVEREVSPQMAVYAPMSEFIFKGTVKVLHTSTINAKEPESLGVVQVTDIIKSPKSMSTLKGKDITVRFNNITNVNTGDQLILFSNAYVLGSEVAVAEVGRMKPDDAKYSVANLTASAEDATKHYEDDQLRERLARSELVVSGKITAVNVLKLKHKVDSEHDPVWTEATVQVAETMKGKADKTITFVFPGSTDVAWYRASKFKQGDQGVFLLGKGKLKAELGERYVIIDKGDFYTDNARISRIRSFIKK